MTNIKQYYDQHKTIPWQTSNNTMSNIKQYWQTSNNTMTNIKQYYDKHQTILWQTSNNTMSNIKQYYDKHQTIPRQTSNNNMKDIKQYHDKCQTILWQMTNTTNDKWLTLSRQMTDRLIPLWQMVKITVTNSWQHHGKLSTLLRNQTWTVRELHQAHNFFHLIQETSKYHWWAWSYTASYNWTTAAGEPSTAQTECTTGMREVMMERRGVRETARDDKVSRDRNSYK